MRDLLKFITCGSVDDGKSTLIGHILYDSKLIYADQARALELDSKVGSRGGAIDYSLLLDGLLAEREQGITIDVAYRYFTTDERSFIVADTPGHEEYTRNMAVGASFADLAVILVDATQGVLVQTRRHARICALVGIRNFVFAVNKMDLAGYDETTFRGIEREIVRLSADLGLRNVHAIPVSATEGDNVTTPSANTPWYDGLALLPYLETVEVDRRSLGEGFYLPVQRVSRPDRTFRGFQGQVEANAVRVGDEVTVLPSRQAARVKTLHVAGREAQEAYFGQPVTVTLDREVDVSRGCVLEAGARLKVASSLAATVLWMDDEPLTPGADYYVRLGTREVAGVIAQIQYAIDVNTGQRSRVDRLEKNEIAVVRLNLTEPIVADEFKNHRTMGEFILVDRVTHATAACGVVERVDDTDASRADAADSHLRTVIKGQSGIIVEFPLAADGNADENGAISADAAATPGDAFKGSSSEHRTPEVAAFDTLHTDTAASAPGTFTLAQVKEIEKRLITQGRDAYLYVPNERSHVTEVITHLNRAGVTVLLALSPEVSRTLPRRSENLIFRNWQEKAGTDPESVVAYIKQMTAAEPSAGQEGAYI